MIFKKIYVRINDRRENIEDFIADKILANLDENEKIDKLEEKGILAAFEAADAYLATYGCPSLPDDVKEKIAKSVVDALGKANKAIQKQLKKKSKSYIKRHGENLEPEETPQERPHQETAEEEDE